MCLRILMHVNTLKSAEELEFVYLRGALALRPDLREWARQDPELEPVRSDPGLGKLIG